MVEIKTRIGAIIINDGKLLMLKGKGHKELWTPGGKIEKNENDEECLRRELKEEIGVEIVNFKFYKEYIAKSFYHNYMLRNKIYIVSIKGKLKPLNEIEKFYWLSKKEFEKHTFPMTPVTEEQIIPDLIKDKYFV